LFANNLGLLHVSIHLVAIHSSAAGNHNKTKTPIFGVQGHSRSSMLTFLRISLPALAMTSSMSF